MIILTTENIRAYLLKNTSIFSSDRLSIEDLSDYQPTEELEGFVNYIFRVADGNRSVIVKQARPYLKYFGEKAWHNDQLVLACYRMRDIFMKRGECLIHGDLHTSNIFIGPGRMQVIDMEYTFMGPYSFDLGYLLANFVSQYAAHTFRSDLTATAREQYCRYLLDTVQAVYTNYLDWFHQCWNQHGKAAYRSLPGYLDSVLESFLPDVIGFASCANLVRLISLADFPDYDTIPSLTDRQQAQALSVAIDEYCLLNRHEFKTVEDWIQAIVSIRDTYLARCSFYQHA